MNDLNTLLERAAGPTGAPVDAHADLTRGHRALSRTRRRRGALGLVGVAAAGVVGVGIARVTDPGGDVAADKNRTQHPVKGTGITFLAQPFEAGPYTFDQTPEGWEVQGANAYAVTIAPIGFPDQEPLSFVGKLVILFDDNRPSGEQVELDGRTFWIRGSDEYTTIATRTRGDEPHGVVSIQYPDDTGWSRDTMLAFLAGVHVGAGALQGVG
jgi:hypothetical protein